MNAFYHRSFFVCMWLLAASSFSDAFGQWNTNPALNNPVCTTAGTNQFQPQLVPDGAGGAYITWMESPDFNTSQIYAQHLSADGNRLWPVTGIPVTAGPGLYSQVQITNGGADGVIISWIDIAGTVIKHYVQKISSGGQRLWNANGVAVCPASVTQTFFYQLLSDGQGGTFLLWDDQRNGPNEVYAQRIGANGNLLWAAAGISCSPPFTNISGYEAVADTVGGVILCWTLTTGLTTRNDVFVQHMNGQGVAQWGAGGTNICQAPKDQLYAKIAKDAADNVIVIWQDFRLDPVKSQLYGQRIAADGSLRWQPGGVLLADSVVAASTVAKIVTDTLGGVQMAWLDLFAPLPSTIAHLYSIHIDSMGIPLAAKKEIATWQDLQMPVDFEWIPDYQGGAFCSFTRPPLPGPGDSQYDIFAQHLMADGSTQFPLNGQPISIAAQVQYYQQLASDSNGVAILAWSDLRNGADFDLYAATLTVQAALPVSWLSFSGAAINDRVLLKWTTANEINNNGFIVQRSSNGIHFGDIGFVPAGSNQGPLSYTFTDMQPLPGTVFYRLNQLDRDGKTAYSRVIRVNSGVANAFRLFPNPVHNLLQVQGNIAYSTITLHAADGRKIKVIQAGATNVIYIGLNGLPAGNYYLSVSSAATHQTYGFIKQ